MKKGILSILMITAFLFATGCALKNSKNYKLSVYKEDPNLNVVTMKTFDPESEEFTVRYDTREWTLEEWEEDLAPNRVVLVNVNSDEKQKCLILLGTIGQGLGEGNQAIEGSLLTQRFVGRTIDIYNPIGIHMTHVVGYEIGEVPYIFETRLPSKDPEACELASQAVLSSFDLKNAPQAEAVDNVVETVDELTEQS